MEQIINEKPVSYEANFAQLKREAKKVLPTQRETEILMGVIVLSQAMLEMLQHLDKSAFKQHRMKFLMNELGKEIQGPRMNKFLQTYWNTEANVYSELSKWYQGIFQILGNSMGYDELQLLGIATAEIKEDKHLFAKKIGIEKIGSEDLELAEYRDYVRGKINKLPNMHLVKSVDAYIENVIKPQIPKSNDSKA